MCLYRTFLNIPVKENIFVGYICLNPAWCPNNNPHSPDNRSICHSKSNVKFSQVPDQLKVC